MSLTGMEAEVVCRADPEKGAFPWVSPTVHTELGTPLPAAC